ncbi:MAG TPA: hypothetical protein VFR18_05635 [Terriglobia bacterium]|nr:hypothetical protein [Terriglobia bacterium]
METPGDEKAGSILRELIFNQYQAIVAGGAAVASLITLNPLPLLVWLGGEFVLLPILDSGPVRRYVHRKRRASALQQTEAGRSRVISSFRPEYLQQYREMENLCRHIEANYQGLHGISQAYLYEQRGKLDMILDGCLNRILALQRYERLLESRDKDEVEEEITRLQEELEQPQLTDRARAAIQKNLELKQKLLTSDHEARGTVKALVTELDTMKSLLEVLHQNSISLRDPQAVSHELDSIVRQSEDSGRMIREIESMLRPEGADWRDETSLPSLGEGKERPGAAPTRRPQQRVKDK